MIKQLHSYTNGNYQVTIFDDGTKVRETEADEFRPQFSENIDIKITNYCDANCAWCHEKSTTLGLDGDIMNAAFIDTLMPGTELAIGGGNPLSHPQLTLFLKKLSSLGVIANLTVNQFHIVQPDYKEIVDYLVAEKLVWGIGLSMKTPTQEFINIAKSYKNAVIHTIAGINPVSHYQSLGGHGLKVLILGYKTFGRGIQYASPSVNSKLQELYNNLYQIYSGFKVVSFDNLAIEQLKPQRFMSKEKWDEFYMGDDGTHTFYIDAVKMQYGKNSTANERYDIGNKSVKEMFQHVLTL